MYGETRKESYDIDNDYAKHAVSITPDKTDMTLIIKVVHTNQAVDGTSGKQVVERPMIQIFL